MTIDELPGELRGLVATYNDKRSRSNAAWSNTGGSIADNEARVRESDRLAGEASDTMDEIRAACGRLGVSLSDVEPFLQ